MKEKLDLIKFSVLDGVCNPVGNVFGSELKRYGTGCKPVPAKYQKIHASVLSGTSYGWHYLGKSNCISALRKTGEIRMIWIPVLALAIVVIGMLIVIKDLV